MSSVARCAAEPRAPRMIDSNDVGATAALVL
jgi:hypothetical protein